MTVMTKEQIEALLEAVAQNQPRVCVAWCGKAKDDCACYKSGVAVGALNDAAPDLRDTALALMAQLEDAKAEVEKLREDVQGWASNATEAWRLFREAEAERDDALARLAAAEAQVGSC